MVNEASVILPKKRQMQEQNSKNEKLLDHSWPTSRTHPRSRPYLLLTSPGPIVSSFQLPRRHTSVPLQFRQIIEGHYVEVE